MPSLAGEPSHKFLPQTPVTSAPTPHRLTEAG